mgnify:FL=1
MVYATCSVFKTEGQEQSDAFLQRQSDARSLDLAAVTGHLLPLPENRQSDSALVRASPNWATDGFFYAVLSKLH